MMLPDHVDERLGQMIFAGERLSIADMGDDHLRRFERGQKLVDIDARLLIFGIKLGIGDLPDIVIERADPAKQAVRPDRLTAQDSARLASTRQC